MTPLALPSPLPGIATQLHWFLAWVLLPLCALLAGSGALRKDLPRGWTVLMGCAAWMAVAALALRVVQHGLAQWGAPAWVWFAAPVLFFVLMVQNRSATPVLVTLACAMGVALLGCGGILLRWLAGPQWLVWLNDAVLLASLPLLTLGLWKHLRTPAPVPTPDSVAAPAPPEPSDTPHASAKRQARLDKRLASQAAQEAADKYTRE